MQGCIRRKLNGLHGPLVLPTPCKAVQLPAAEMFGDLEAHAQHTERIALGTNC